jgi:hypothetical protein
MRPLLLLLLLPSLAATPATQPTRYENGPPTSPDFFPLTVWLQNPANARRYKELGINVFVGLHRGPTAEQLDALDQAGIHAICHLNQRAQPFINRKTIIAWMHGDEPDNAQPLPGRQGWGPPIPPEKIIADYQRLKQSDPTRPIFLNLGQGVAWDQWHGRGVRTNHPEDYPHYLKGCDIASFDIYPVTHDRPAVAGNLGYVARGVQRLIIWTEGKKPVWCCIETTHISNEKAMPTPAQIKTEVWMAITHGATGIVYFCHEFKPRFIEAGLLAYPDNARAVKEINARIRQLAPILNSPTRADLATVESSDRDVPISLLAKQHGGSIWLFAVSMRHKPTTASFKLPTLPAGTQVEVLDEARTLTAANAQFTDRFEGYAVHLYRLSR